MSVWLPVRPSHVVILNAQSLVLRRQLGTFLPRSHLLLHRVQAQQRHYPEFRRWQSTKEPASSVNSVPAPADGKSSAAVAAKDDSTKVAFPSRMWNKVKHEAAHYWHGTKLLVSEVRISARLQWKILHGETLTRRERRQVRAPCQTP